MSFAYIEHDSAIDMAAPGPLSDLVRIRIRQEAAAASDAPSEPGRLLILSFSGKAVRQAISRRFHAFAPYEHWLGALPDTPSLRALRSMADWLVPELEREGSALATDGRARRHAERLLLSLFVESLAATTPADATPAEELCLAQVRRAEAWIEAHLTDAIGVEEIAAAAGASLRSVQRSFRRVRDCTPQQFLTRRRLEAARVQLLRSGPDATVTEIATSLGFFELSRFAQRYRQHFGESPSATLARCD